MFGWFKKKKRSLLNEQEQELVLAAIQEAERRTSGEIRVFVESHCGYVDSMDRAREVFFNLKMEATKARNAVLVYVAVNDHQMALFGDEGIFKKTDIDRYWIKEVELMRGHFQQGQIATGIAAVVRDIGIALHQHFPYDAQVDKNELPDDIVFGH